MMSVCNQRAYALLHFGEVMTSEYEVLSAAGLRFIPAESKQR
jgi:hypothetical protein